MAKNSEYVLAWIGKNGQPEECGKILWLEDGEQRKRFFTDIAEIDKITTRMHPSRLQRMLVDCNDMPINLENDPIYIVELLNGERGRVYVPYILFGIENYDTRFNNIENVDLLNFNANERIKKRYASKPL